MKLFIYICLAFGAFIFSGLSGISGVSSDGGSGEQSVITALIAIAFFTAMYIHLG